MRVATGHSILARSLPALPAGRQAVGRAGRSVFDLQSAFENIYE
ncbi:MAG TPA: hypothetical protein VN328_00260 [Thermodesulfovibrionales bacterium]|nr:hypothetical protein [Thermodesulfovibrionales bacterium]